MEIINSGAEAIIYLDGTKIIKERISKNYRHKEIDKKIITRRTKAETKILTQASEIINTPKPEETKEKNKIIMPYIEGDKLSESLNFYEETIQEKIMFEIGKSIAKIHENGIIHGDLTTSNIIFQKKENNFGKIFIIDFGLGFLNGKYEDKGVDLHLLKQALEAKHFQNAETLFKEFEIGYRSINPKEAEKVFDKMKAIEKRGRYKH